jgi:hypothetical protein
MLRRHELLRFARTGAEARLQELRQELESIYAAFPDLRRGGVGSRTRTAGRQAKRPRARRQSWTAAQRKAVSDRMRKYWAARKAARK